MEKGCLEESCLERLVVDFGWIQARLFGGPLLDVDGFQPFFRSPHRRERMSRRFGMVVELVEYFLQSEVLHKEDHGCL